MTEEARLTPIKSAEELAEALKETLVLIGWDGVDVAGIFSMMLTLADVEISMKVFKEKWGEHHKTWNDQYYYVWIELGERLPARSEKTAIVVGLTHFSEHARSNFGDLFDPYQVSLAASGQRILKELNLLEQFIEDCQRYEKMINDYVRAVIIIPLNVGVQARIGSVRV